MYKAIIWDADGVTILNNEFFSQTYARNNDVDTNLMVPFFTGPFQDCLVGKKDTATELEPFLKQWKWNGTVHEFITLWCETENNPDRALLAYIQELRAQGVTCMLATNNDSYRTAYLKNEMQFLKYFNEIYSSSEIGTTKASTKFFSAIVPDICQRADCTQEGILFLDDDEKNIKAAQAYGLATYHYTTRAAFQTYRATLDN